MRTATVVAWTTTQQNPQIWFKGTDLLNFVFIAHVCVVQEFFRQLEKDCRGDLWWLPIGLGFYASQKFARWRGDNQQRFHCYFRTSQRGVFGSSNILFELDWHHPEISLVCVWSMQTCCKDYGQMCKQDGWDEVAWMSAWISQPLIFCVEWLYGMRFVVLWSVFIVFQRHKVSFWKWKLAGFQFHRYWKLRKKNQRRRPCRSNGSNRDGTDAGSYWAGMPGTSLWGSLPLRCGEKWINVIVW